VKGLSAFLVMAALSSCGKNETEPPNRLEPPESRLEPGGPPPEESRPFQQGFTQRPPRDFPGLPPPVDPLLDEAVLAALPEKALRASEESRARAQTEILTFLDELERAAPEEFPSLVARIRKAAVEQVSEGALSYGSAESFYRDFLYPNDGEAVDAASRGKAFVLTGAVAPHNMLDVADGFKLFETTPYVHEPVLLATEYEMSFLRCHLLRRELQKLRDWQELHLVGVFEGKIRRGDLVLRRCVVL
jgi:hypothetical protein